MDAQLIIALLNPALGALLGTTFLLLWLNQRERTFLLVSALAFASMGLGSLVLDVLPGWPFSAERLFANFLFLAGAALVAAAIVMRRGLAVPVAQYACLIGCALAGVFWFLLVTPNIGVRIGVVNSALGAIAFILAFQLLNVREKQLIDWLMFSVAMLAAANYFFRPVLIAYLMGGFGEYGVGPLSFYAATMIFSQAILCVMFALNLIVANAIDLQADLWREANVDRLSGLNNRRGFETAANHELDRCAARGEPVCLLIADLDHFKTINDTWGHAAGDRVIALFGQRLLALCEEQGVAGRIGGEEFAILLPATGLPDARRFAQKLRMQFSHFDDAGLPEGLVATVSIGIAHTGDPFVAGSADDRAGLYGLLNDADKALYRAKHAGRNQVHIFTPASDDAPEADPGRDLLTA